MHTETNCNKSESEAAFDAIYYLQAQYFAELSDRLLEDGYLPQLYLEKDSVMRILEFSIHYFAEKFEKWCVDSLKNPKDIGQILWLYSFYEKGKNSGKISLSELDIIGLYTCRYILAIAPKLSLSSNERPFFNDSEVCLPELFALTNSLMSVSQFRTAEGLSDHLSVKIDLTDNFIKIDYINEEFISLLNKSKTKGEVILAPQYVDYSIAVDFKNLLVDVFGIAADSLFNIFSYENEQEDVKPKDFTPYSNLYGNSIFAKELILDSNSVDFYSVITKPHSNNHRTRFKPLLKLNIDENFVIVSTKWLIFEAISELSLNRLPFNGLPKSWLKIDRIKQYADFISNEVGTNFENLVSSKISNQFPHKHDIKNIGNTSVEDFPVFENGEKTNRTVGQIDFIIINEIKHIIYIADAKHLKSKYIVTSFYNDKSKFDNYYIKLRDKAKWANEHKELISDLFGLDVTSYSVQELFITEAYIFYALYVDYPIIPLVSLNTFLDTNRKLCYLE